MHFIVSDGNCCIAVLQAYVLPSIVLPDIDLQQPVKLT